MSKKNYNMYAAQETCQKEKDVWTIMFTASLFAEVYNVSCELQNRHSLLSRVFRL